MCAALLVGCAAVAYKPAEERDLREIAQNGCNNRNGDFIVRGLISNATEDTVVLSDTADATTSMSLTLPGRGPLARVKGVFTRNKYEATQARLDELRDGRRPVTVTLKCRRGGTPEARNISYVTADGARESISF